MVWYQDYNDNVGTTINITTNIRFHPILAKNYTITNATNNRLTSISTILQCISPKLEEACSLVATILFQVMRRCQMFFHIERLLIFQKKSGIWTSYQWMAATYIWNSYRHNLCIISSIHSFFPPVIYLPFVARHRLQIYGRDISKQPSNNFARRTKANYDYHHGSENSPKSLLKKQYSWRSLTNMNTTSLLPEQHTVKWHICENCDTTGMYLSTYLPTHHQHRVYQSQSKKKSQRYQYHIKLARIVQFACQDQNTFHRYL